MPAVDYDGNVSFKGGMEMRYDRIDSDQYRYSENTVLRRGYMETRPSFVRAFRSLQSGLKEAFYFGDENDPSGFWFPFTFIGSVWGANLQGGHLFQFDNDTVPSQIVVVAGEVFINQNGFVSTIPTENDIPTDSKVKFVQANNYLIMFMTGNQSPMYWNWDMKEFTEYESGVVSDIPNAIDGEYAHGRVWSFLENDSDLYASDIYSFKDWDYAKQLFGIKRGDGDSIIRVIEYKDNYLLVFKHRKLYAISGVNAYYDPSTSGLNENVRVETVSKEFGLVSRDAVATSGDMVAFLSHRGIMTLSRTSEGNLTGVDVPLSASIQPVIDRINWNYATSACAVEFDNMLLFSVPLDNSRVNNAILVYDLLLHRWVSVWRSRVAMPIKFFIVGDVLYFVCTDGVLRKLEYGEYYKDSMDYYDDAFLWNEDDFFSAGQKVYIPNDGNGELYTANIGNKGITPIGDSTGTWTQDTDPSHAYDIETKFHTQFYEFNNPVDRKKINKAMVHLLSCGARYKVKAQGDDLTELDILDYVEHDDTKYSVELDDWETDNSNLDFNVPNRMDYMWRIRSDESFYMDSTGIKIVYKAHHTVRYCPMVIFNRRISLKLESTKGYLGLKSMMLFASHLNTGHRER